MTQDEETRAMRRVQALATCIALIVLIAFGVAGRLVWQMWNKGG